MNEVTVTGKTVDEAVAKALEMLSATADQVEVEIISREKKGVLGIGSQDAGVRVRLIQVAADPASEGEAYLCQILNAMGLDDYDVNIDKDDTSITYRVTTEADVGFVIGYHGDVLDALSAVVSLSVNKDKDAHYRVNVDLNGYREKRIESLKDYARRAIDKARSSGYVTVANPMKPFERMILHTEVQEAVDVVSWSEGEEPRRRVIIAPLSKVRKVDDRYERIDRKEGFRARDDRRRDENSRGRSDNFSDRRGGRSGSDRNDRGGRGGDRRDRPAPKPIKTESFQIGRPVKSDFAAGGLYSKIEVETKPETDTADKKSEE